MRRPSSPVPCLLGATAVGKSDVGVELARRLGAEVVCCDALTVYRGVDLLTAKPRVPRDVPHHLLDVVEPWESYHAAAFAADADRLVGEIRARGRVPLVVGGTALYLKVWTKGLGPRVGRDDALRASLEALAAAQGNDALVARLASLDPVRAAQVHRNDRRRLVRAIEIAESGGRLPSALRTQWRSPDRVATRLVGLRRAPQDLARRIRARTEAMFRDGLAEEVRRLSAGPRPPSRELGQAIGWADVVAWIDGGIPEAACRERIARATARFAKRQTTFFRQFPSATWLDVSEGEDPATTAARVQEALAAPDPATLPADPAERAP